MYLLQAELGSNLVNKNRKGVNDAQRNMLFGYHIFKHNDIKNPSFFIHDSYKDIQYLFDFGNGFNYA
jgi:hypothetical protein